MGTLGGEKGETDPRPRRVLCQAVTGLCVAVALKESKDTDSPGRARREDRPWAPDVTWGDVVARLALVVAQRRSTTNVSRSEPLSRQSTARGTQPTSRLQWKHSREGKGLNLITVPLSGLESDASMTCMVKVYLC